MIRSLRRKFLAVTMSLISLVLLIVFCALIFGTYSQQMAYINMSLSQVIDGGFSFDLPKEQFGKQANRSERVMTTLSLLVDADGNVVFSNADNVEISDDDMASAISSALASGEGSGYLRELGLYFACNTFDHDSTFNGRGAFFPSASDDLPQPESTPATGSGGAASTGLQSTATPESTPPALPDDALNPDTSGVHTQIMSALADLPDGAVLYRLAFVSDSNMHQAMGNLIMNSLLVGAGALIVLFVICLFLANWALKPVERTWNQQKRFISDASHELKTPLTVILANLDIMKKHSRETIDSQRKWVDNSEDEALHMKQLVEDLLTLARLDEVGQTAAAPELQELDMTDAVWASLLTFEPVAFEQGLLLDSNIAPDIHVCGDAQKLQQLTTILLDNACKYAGKRGSVTVTLSATADKVRLAVGNTGEVIPPENLAHLFERFYRADAARTGEKGGYGLGLSIAAGIAQLHKGSISATSDAENGTVFTVILPRVEKQ